jgi:hypothetical protein
LQLHHSTDQRFTVMPRFDQSPTARRLKVKLQVLLKPAVWGSAAVLGVAGLFLAEYLSNPARYMGGGEAIANESTPYDPNPLLNFPNPADFGGNYGRVPTIAPKIDPKAAKSDGSAPSALGEKLEPNNGRSRVNRNSDKSIFSLGTGQATEPLIRSGVFSRMNEENKGTNPSVMGVSPLQSALDRQAAERLGDRLDSNSRLAERLGEGIGSNPSNIDRNSRDFAAQGSNVPAGQLTPGNLLPNSSLSTTVPIASPQYQPQYQPRTSPLPGTTGYTPPASLRTEPSASAPGITSLYPNAAGQVTAPQPLPSYRSNTRVSPLSSQPGSFRQPTFGPAAVEQQNPASRPPEAFSVPYSAPGQSIGGGRIDSFSNP